MPGTPIASAYALANGTNGNASRSTPITRSVGAPPLCGAAVPPNCASVWSSAACMSSSSNAMTAANRHANGLPSSPPSCADSAPSTVFATAVCVCSSHSMPNVRAVSSSCGVSGSLSPSSASFAASNASTMLCGRPGIDSAPSYTNSASGMLTASPVMTCANVRLSRTCRFSAYWASLPMCAALVSGHSATSSSPVCAACRTAGIAAICSMLTLLFRSMLCLLENCLLSCARGLGPCDGIRVCDAEHVVRRVVVGDGGDRRERRLAQQHVVLGVAGFEHVPV